MSVMVTQPRRRAGRPACCPPETARRILELKNQGYSLRQIARLLNDEVVPTPMGLAKWSKSHVDRVLGTLYMQELSAEASR
jgi:hypothetical protein